MPSNSNLNTDKQHNTASKLTQELKAADLNLEGDRFLTRLELKAKQVPP
jgi:hypothetical protein